MAKLHHLGALAALYLTAAFAVSTGPAAATPTFSIHGRVYCDTCRAGFETTATEYVAGAKVKVECRNFSNDAVVQTAEGVTDKLGNYKITIADDHQEEICESILLESPLKGCSEVKPGRDRARIMLTDNVGMTTNIRYANSLGFLKDEPLPLCGKLLLQYSLADDEEY